MLEFLFSGVSHATLLKKKQALAQVLSCEFRKIFKSTFFPEHPWTTASVDLSSSVFFCGFLCYTSNVFVFLLLFSFFINDILCITP